jgi:hypothetical protein
MPAGHWRVESSQRRGAGLIGPEFQGLMDWGFITGGQNHDFGVEEIVYERDVE